MSHARQIGMSLALVLAACGPPRIADTPDGADVSANETDTGSTSATSTTGVPPDTETETETDTDTSTTFGFVPLFDEPTGPAACDPFMQDCPDGEKCVPYSSTGSNWDASKCVPVLGDQMPGESCTYSGLTEATDDCDATSFCWDVMDGGGEAVGTCTRFCLGSAQQPECPLGYTCLHTLVNMCIKTCDPILQDCGAGLACYWANNDFHCIFTTDDLAPGEPCGLINDCAGGLFCTDAQVLPDCAGSSCCAPFCDLDLGDAQCDVLPGTVCAAFFEEGTALPGYEHLGVCILPG